MFISNHIAGRVPLVIGVGGNSTSEVLDQLREFDLRRADAILSAVSYTHLGYVEHDELGLSPQLSQKINDWLERYWNEFYGRYKNPEIVKKLDEEGQLIARLLMQEFESTGSRYLPLSNLNLRENLPDGSAARM